MASHHGGGQGGLNGAMQGLITILALISTVFLAPQVWPLIQADVRNWLNDLYAPSIARWLHLGGMIATYPLTFLALRAALIAAITAIWVLIANRSR